MPETKAGRMEMTPSFDNYENQNELLGSSEAKRALIHTGN